MIKVRSRNTTDLMTASELVGADVEIRLRGMFGAVRVTSRTGTIAMRVTASRL